MPDWKFGDWNTSDPRAQFRQRLWWWAHRHGYDGPVTTDWYLGLRWNHHLMGDFSFCTYVDGRYEPNEMFSVANLLKPGMSFVDIGAHEGIFSLLAAVAVGPDGAVHAFEPSPRERARLAANITLNRLENVHVHPVALGETSHTATLLVSDAEHPGHNTLGAFSHRETTHAYSVDVNVETLDRFVEQLAIERIDLMKLDVEGSESAVLKGAATTLNSFRPVLILEAQQTALERMGSSVEELLRLLASHGYRIETFGRRPKVVQRPSDIDSVNLICRPASATPRPVSQ